MLSLPLIPYIRVFSTYSYENKSQNLIVVKDSYVLLLQQALSAILTSHQNQTRQMVVSAI